MSAGSFVEKSFHHHHHHLSHHHYYLWLSHHYLFVCLSVCLFVCVSVCVCLPVFPSVRPPVCLPACLPLCLSVRQSVRLPVCLPIHGHPSLPCPDTAQQYDSRLQCCTQSVLAIGCSPGLLPVRGKNKLIYQSWCSENKWNRWANI